MAQQNLVDFGGVVGVMFGSSPSETCTTELAVGRAQVGDTPSSTPKNDLFDTADPWYAVHVQGRREERFVSLMHAAGVPVFYPTEAVIRRRRRREKNMRHLFANETVRRGTFHGYCFIAADADAIHAAKDTNLIYSIHRAEQTQLLAALRRIKETMESRGDRPREKYIRPGTECVVTSGAFMNVRGKWVSDHRGRGHLLCTFAGQPNTQMTIDVELLEPV